MQNMLSSGDGLLPAALVAEHFSVSMMTLHRWLKSDKLDFPRPIYINKRRYFRSGELKTWEMRQADRSAA